MTKFSVEVPQLLVTSLFINVVKIIEFKDGIKLFGHRRREPVHVYINDQTTTDSAHCQCGFVSYIIPSNVLSISIMGLPLILSEHFSTLWKVPGNSL